MSSYYKAEHTSIERGQFVVITKWDDFITKWDRYYKVGNFITKWDSFWLLQSGTILLQSGTAFVITKWDDFITKWNGYYKVGRLYYKVGQVLQSGTIITKWALTYETKVHHGRSRFMTSG